MNDNLAFTIAVVVISLSVAAVKIVEYVYGCGGGL
jgi:hypothetical protein